MNAPIKREDIRKGDKIRLTSVREFISDRDSTWTDIAGTTYELIERPVVLPTEVDTVISWETPYMKGLASLKKADQWRHADRNYTSVEMLARIADTAIGDSTFTLLRPVAEVAAEVLAEAHMAIEGSLAAPHSALDSIAIKFGVTE